MSTGNQTSEPDTARDGAVHRPPADWRRPLLRAVVSLVLGALIGLGIQYWRRQAGQAAAAAGQPAAAGTGVDSPAASAALDVTKTRAAARAWFRSGGLMIENGELQKLLPWQIERIESLTSGELREWLEEGRSGGVTYALMEMLMERWAEIDQPAFIAWIEMLKRQPSPGGLWTSWSYSSDLNPPWVTPAINILKRIDPETKVKGSELMFRPIGSMDWLSPPIPADERPVGEIPDLATLSADEAIRWLVRCRNDMNGLKEAVKKIALTDSRAALAWAQNIPPHLDERREAIKAALLAGNKDGAWLLENVHLLKRPDDVQEVLGRAESVFDGSKESRSAFLTWLETRMNADERKTGLAILVKNMDFSDRREALAVLERLKDRADRSTWMDAMLMRMDREGDWKRLLPLIAAQPGSGKEAMGAGVAAAKLAEKGSVEEAIAWAEKLPPDGRQANALAGAYTVWARRDTAAASQAAMELPAGEARTAALVSVAAVQAERFPREALLWSQTLEVEARAGILPRLAANLATHYGAEARAEAVQLLASRPDTGSDEVFQTAMKTLMPELSTRSGQAAAMQWIEAMPAGALRDGLVEQMYWEAGQVEGVKAWLEKQGRGR